MEEGLGLGLGYWLGEKDMPPLKVGTLEEGEM